MFKNQIRLLCLLVTIAVPLSMLATGACKPGEHKSRGHCCKEGMHYCYWHKKCQPNRRYHGEHAKSDKQQKPEVTKEKSHRCKHACHHGCHHEHCHGEAK